MRSNCSGESGLNMMPGTVSSCVGLSSLTVALNATVNFHVVTADEGYKLGPF